MAALIRSSSEETPAGHITDGCSLLVQAQGSRDRLSRARSFSLALRHFSSALRLVATTEGSAAEAAALWYRAMAFDCLGKPQSARFLPVETTLPGAAQNELMRVPR